MRGQLFTKSLRIALKMLALAIHFGDRIRQGGHDYGKVTSIRIPRNLRRHSHLHVVTDRKSHCPQSLRTCTSEGVARGYPESQADGGCDRTTVRSLGVGEFSDRSEERR